MTLDTTKNIQVALLLANTGYVINFTKVDKCYGGSFRYPILSLRFHQ